MNSDLDWDQFLSNNEVETAEPKDPWPHQKEAIAKVLVGLSEKDSRDKMVMACGTGKTFTSLRIAEELIGKGGRVLYLVPSLSLMSQTIREWTKDSRIPLSYYAVC
ncbi:MAG: DEAD/DEAH box helicase family protein [Bacteroidetes bacterium]|nr:DEAD/DEAH box helicase family protein [Bacteroidota bacterium]